MRTLQTLRLFSLLSLCALPGAALASPPEASTPPPEPLCLRGGPARDCEGFILTEFAGYIAPPAPYRRPPLNFIWEAGYMRNLEGA